MLEIWIYDKISLKKLMNSGDAEPFYEVMRRSDQSLEKYHYMLVLSLYTLQ